MLRRKTLVDQSAMAGLSTHREAYHVCADQLGACLSNWARHSYGFSESGS
jgi:hypothetical protein